MREIKQIIVHCSDSTFGTAKWIDKIHRTERNFDMIGYHYVIMNGFEKSKAEYKKENDGKIETGREIERPGAHCKDANYDSIGICLIGVDNFTPLQIESLLSIIERMRERFGKLAVYGHYEKPSGRKQGKTCPNINMVEFRKEWSLN